MSEIVQGDLDRYKFLASEYAVQFVKAGMVVGLGFGSTAIHALRLIGQKVQSGELSGVRAVPTAASIEAQAHEQGIPIAEIDMEMQIDVTIDGADEIDPELRLIKGGGGALLREKIVAQATQREIIVADYTKLSPRLGTRFDLPVEVLAFGWRSQASYLAEIGAEVSRRVGVDGKPFVSDSGNYILDCHFGPIENAEKLAAMLEKRAGIVEHGLFLELASEAVIAGPDGVQHIQRGQI